MAAIRLRRCCTCIDERYAVGTNNGVAEQCKLSTAGVYLLVTSAYVGQAHRGLTKFKDVCLLTDVTSNGYFRSCPAFHAHTLSAALQPSLSRVCSRSQDYHKNVPRMEIEERCELSSITTASPACHLAMSRPC